MHAHDFPEFGLTRQVRPSHHAPAYSFSTLKLNLVLTQGIPPDFRDGAHIYRQPPSDQSQIYRIAQLRTDGVHCQESPSTGPVVLKAVPGTGAAFSGFTLGHFLCASLFSHPLMVWSGFVGGWFSVEQSVRQWWVLAPLLFNIFAAFLNVVYTRFKANKDFMDALMHLRKTTGAGGWRKQPKVSQPWRLCCDACCTLMMPKSPRICPRSS